MIITAPTLDEAYKKASSTLNCSIVELDIEVIQHPTKGFLGLFKKEAIIKINLKPNQTKPKKEKKELEIKKEVKKDLDLKKVQKEIEDGIKRLLDSSCFDLHLEWVKIEDGIVHIKLDGEDAALMIGKEGYRYKALSYMFHNWIKLKYDLSISLEVAEFLKNQTQNVKAYIQMIKPKIDETKKFQTKPLDGILVKLALEELRRLYPNMYVAIKTLKDGKKVVVINENRSLK